MIAKSESIVIDDLTFEKYEESLLVSVAETASTLFSREPTLLRLCGKFIVVGDLHGNIQDLYRIFCTYDTPPQTSYLFLGDMIDRGKFSLQTLVLIFSLKISYPNHVYVIRGNHEFGNVCKKKGFYEELSKFYEKPQAIFESFVRCFGFIPLAATIGSVFFVHGGLSPGLVTLSQIESISRPISTYDDPIINGMMWSDPGTIKDLFSNNLRGTGFTFSCAAFDRFMKKNNLTQLVRGHQCVDAFEYSYNNRLLTVFSASNYDPEKPNKAGIAVISRTTHAEPKIIGEKGIKTRAMRNSISFSMLPVLNSHKSHSLPKDGTMGRRLIRNRTMKVYDFE